MASTALAQQIEAAPANLPGTVHTARRAEIPAAMEADVGAACVTPEPAVSLQPEIEKVQMVTAPEPIFTPPPPKSTSPQPDPQRPLANGSSDLGMVVACDHDDTSAESAQCNGYLCPQGALGCGGRGWFRRIKRRLQYTHWGYAEEFEERSLSGLVSAHMGTQILNGMAARMVLYQYDFCDGTADEAAKLNPHGYRRLCEIAAMLQYCSAYPVVIEYTPGNPALDAARRDHVLKALGELTVAVPEQGVIVGVPAVRGLSGEEAFTIHQNLLRDTESGGAGAAALSPAPTIGVSLQQGGTSSGQ